jgi:methionyl-tRNA synthetase
LSNLLQPFLPFSTAKIKEILNLDQTGWPYFDLDSPKNINQSEILFERIDKKQIKIEREKLKLQARV